MINLIGNLQKLVSVHGASSFDQGVRFKIDSNQNAHPGRNCLLHEHLQVL